MNWQPIETAPKDGSEILAAVRYPKDKNIKGVWATFFAYWVTDIPDYPEGIWALDPDTPLDIGITTHWMPVPHYTQPTTES